MGLISTFVKWIRRESSGKAEPTAEQRQPRTGYTWLTSEHGALCISSVFRCVKLLSESVANLPMQYMRQRNAIFVEDISNRLHYLLTVQPNPAQSSFDFWKQAVQNVLLDGNAYIVPVYYMGDINVLVLCGRGTVGHDIAQDVYTVCDYVNGINGVFHENEIIHLKGFTIDGKHGLSVLSYARLTTTIASTGDRETLNRFETGGNVRGLIGKSTSAVQGFGEYQTEQLQKLAADTSIRIQEQPIVAVPGDVDFKQFSLSSTDMQFLESRKFGVREICRFFGVHPSFVFDDTSNNYKSAEMANVAFLSNTLNPILRQIECELHRKLVPHSLCCKYKFQFNRFGLYACDLESKAKYQAQMLATGLYTVNELRRLENRPAIDGGDRAFISANLKGIDEPFTQTATMPEKTYDKTDGKEGEN